MSPATYSHQTLIGRALRTRSGAGPRPGGVKLSGHATDNTSAMIATTARGQYPATFRGLGNNCKEHECRENHQVHDALQHRRPSRAQGDHSQQQRQCEENLVLNAET